MARETATPSVWVGAWLTFTVFAIAVGAFAIARGFVPATTRYFPLAVSAVCIAVASLDIAKRVVLGIRARADRTNRSVSSTEALPPERDIVNEAADAPPLVVLRYAAWFFCYLTGIWVVSMVVASGVFVSGFLRFEARMNWWVSVLSGIIVVVLVVSAGGFFHIRWPSSLINPLGFLL